MIPPLRHAALSNLEVLEGNFDNYFLENFLFIERSWHEF
jgi:hypothetical protein